MAVSLGPNLIEDGLVLSLDAGDINSVMGATVEVLVVAGGGGGGMDIGGGGGGGGVIYNSSYAVTQGTAVTVTVGNGGYGAPAGGGGYRGDGAGPQPGGHQFTISATQGGNSVFGSITATGGGFGGSSYFGYTPNYGYGGSGGSGGGASGYSDTTTGRAGTGTSGQGFNGGGSSGQYYSGGGGGAGGAGVSGPNKPNGGPGVLYPTMSQYYFAGGGGGSGHSGVAGNGGVGGGGGGAGYNGDIGSAGAGGINVGSNGSAGLNAPGGNAGANTGGGGGGGSHYNANNKGGDGGSGIVIVRYSGPQKATGGTISTVAGYTIHTFTSSGSFTPYLNWYDSSGNNKTFGLDSSGITWNSGGYFTLANGGAILSSNAITTSTTCTVVIWIKTTDTQALTFKGNNSASFYLAAYTPADAFYSSSCGSPTYWIDTLSVANPNPTYLDGNWHMWEMKNVNFSAWTTFEFNRYGSYTFGNGAVSKIMIYNRNLSSDESLQIYNATKSRHLV